MNAQPAIPPAGEAVPEDAALEFVLSTFNGDPYAALGAAITEIARLEKALALASAGSSYGFSRGWHHKARQQ
jgi:hypothetical protein